MKKSKKIFGELRHFFLFISVVIFSFRWFYDTLWNLFSFLRYNFLKFGKLAFKSSEKKKNLEILDLNNFFCKKSNCEHFSDLYFISKYCNTYFDIFQHLLFKLSKLGDEFSNDELIVTPYQSYIEDDVLVNSTRFYWIQLNSIG